jgi:putative solute:sodium symporter small subunit
VGRTPPAQHKGELVSVETEAPERKARDRHQLRTLVLAVTVLAGVLAVVLVAIAAATWLNRFWFLHYPLGFYVLAQGLIIFIVVCCFWFVRVQERIDRARGESEEIG